MNKIIGSVDKEYIDEKDLISYINNTIEHGHVIGSISIDYNVKIKKTIISIGLTGIKED